MTEEQYDEMIAPQLFAIMKQVAEMGGSFMAYASFEGEDGRSFGETTHLPDKTAAEMIMHMGLRCKGNFDALCMSLKRAEEEGLIDLSNSMYLNLSS